MGHGGQVVFAAIGDDPRIARIKAGIRVVKVENLHPARGIENRKRRSSRGLPGALGHSKEQPDLLLKTKYAWIQKTLYLHSREAGWDIGGSKKWVLRKSACHI